MVKIKPLAYLIARPSQQKSQVVNIIIGMKKQIVLGVVGPLILGGILYLLFRPMTIIPFSLTGQHKFQESIEVLRNSSLVIPMRIPPWVIYNLPDGLWSFAFTTAMLQHWKNKIDSVSIFWIVLTPVVGISIECFQKLNLIKGTFDIADIISVLIGFFLSISIFIRNPKYSIL